MKKLKSFEILTRTKYGDYWFMTKAKNGKEALKRLIKHSSDYDMVGLTESNKMTVVVKWLKSKRDEK